MEIYNLYVDVILEHQKAYKLDKAKLATIASVMSPRCSENFETPYNRCAFMHRFATCNTCFIQDCIYKFLTEYPKAKDLFVTWTSDYSKVLCSLSCGPGIDFLGFILAVLETGETIYPFKNIKIIAKYKAWRKTITFLSRSIKKFRKSSKLPKDVYLQNVQVVQGDILGLLNEKMIATLQKCHVVLMFKTLNLCNSPEEKYYWSPLKALVKHLKPDTTMFFIDSKPSAKMMLATLNEFPGSFLYKPKYYSYEVPVQFPEEFKEKLSVLPVLSTGGVFFVWQKLLPNATVRPESIQSMELINENIEVFKGAESAKCSSCESSPEDTSDDVSNGLGSASKYLNASSSPHQFSSLISNSCPSLKDSSCSNIQSKLSLSASCNFDQLSDSAVTKTETCPSLHKSSTPHGNESMLASGQSDIDKSISFATEISTSVQKNFYPPLDVSLCTEPDYEKVRTLVNDQKPPSPFLVSEVKSNNNQKVIQNAVHKGYISDPPSNLESKSTQTDPVQETSQLDSIRLLSDSLHKLVSCLERRQTQQMNHVRGCGRCNKISFSTHVHCCTACHVCPGVVQKCPGGKSLTCLECEKEPKFHNFDSLHQEQLSSENKYFEIGTSTARCNHCCFIQRCCSQFNHVQFCCKQNA